MKGFLCLTFFLLAGSGAFGQAYDQLPRTTTATNTDLIAIQTNSAGLAGQKFTRSMQLQDLLETMQHFQNWPSASTLTATNVSTTNDTRFGLFAEKIGTVLRFYGLETGSNTLIFFNGSNLVINAIPTTSGGGGGGSGITTNADQFAPVIPLTIRSSAKLTNALIYGRNSITNGSLDLWSVQPPRTNGLTASVGAAGLLIGDYAYKATFVGPYGETTGDDFVLALGIINQRVVLSGIPLGPSPIVTGRRIYRTDGSGIAPYKLVADIADNTTTTFSDNVPDAGLGRLLRDNNSLGLSFFANGIPLFRMVTNLDGGGSLFIGTSSGTNLGEGGANLGIGFQTLQSLTNGAGNVAIGYQTLRDMSQGDANFGAGNGALRLLTNGSYNGAIGQDALGELRNGSRNIAFGRDAGFFTTNTSDSVFLGDFAGENHRRGSFVNYIGAQSGGLPFMSNALAFGYGARVYDPNSAVFGGSNYVGWLTNFYFGSGVSNATPQNVTLHASSGLGTDITGANMALAAGRGSGSARGGLIRLQTSIPGASGSALNSLTDALVASNGYIHVLSNIYTPLLTAAAFAGPATNRLAYTNSIIVTNGTGGITVARAIGSDGVVHYIVSDDDAGGGGGVFNASQFTNSLGTINIRKIALLTNVSVWSMTNEGVTIFYGPVTNNSYFRQEAAAFFGGNVGFFGDVTNNGSVFMAGPSDIFYLDNSTRIDIGRLASHGVGASAIRFGTNAYVAGLGEGISDNAEHRRYRWYGDNTGNDTNLVQRWWEVSNYVSSASGIGEVNVNGEVSVTNATKIGLVHGKAGVTNRLRSVEAGNGLNATNQGTNVIFAVSDAELLEWMSISTNKAMFTNSLTIAGGSGGITAVRSISGGLVTWTISDDDAGAGGGEANVNGEVSVTNATKIGWVHGKAGVTNRLRSAEAGNGLNATNQGTNVVFAIADAELLEWMSISTNKAMFTNSLVLAGGSGGITVGQTIIGGLTTWTINGSGGSGGTIDPITNRFAPANIFTNFGTLYQSGDMQMPGLSPNSMLELDINGNVQGTLSRPLVNNFFSMGITNIVAGPGISIGTNAGLLYITNTGTAGTSVTFTNQLWVDLRGNDTTGARNDPSKPFQSITNAIRAALSNDVINIGAGRFTNYAPGIILSNNLTLRGLGRNNTVLLFTNNHVVHGTCLKPMTNTVVEDLALEVAHHVVGTVCAPIGFHESFTDIGGTNVVFKNVRVKGFSDNIIVLSTSNIVQMRFYDCEFESSADVVVLHGHASNSLYFKNCRINTAGPVAPAVAVRMLNMSAGFVHYDTSSLVATNNSAETWDALNLIGGSARLENCYLSARTNSGSANLVRTIGTGKVEFAGMLQLTNNMLGNVSIETPFVAGLAAGAGVTLATNSAGVVTVTATGGGAGAYIADSTGRGTNLTLTGNFQVTNTTFVLFGTPNEVGIMTNNLGVYQNGGWFMNTPGQQMRISDGASAAVENGSQLSVGANGALGTTASYVLIGTNDHIVSGDSPVVGEVNRYRFAADNTGNASNMVMRAWEVRTNLYDIEADAYFTRAGVTNLVARWRLDGFIKSMKAAGIWDEVIDGATYYPEQNRPSLGSNYYTFKNVDTVITTNRPVQMVHGLSIASGIDFVGYAMTDWRTGSVAVVVRASTNTTAGSVAWMANNSASSQHEIGAYWPADQYLVGVTKWNNASAGTPLFYLASGTQGANIWDPMRHTCLLTTDGNGIMRTYTDGIFSFQNTTMTIVSNALTRFNIGTRGGYGSYEVPFGKYAIGNWLRFNRVLTAAEAADLEMCLMWLEDADEHWIIEGDSMSYHHDGVAEGLNNWPSQLYMMGASNRVVMHNVAATGEAASVMVAQTNQWFKYRPGQFGILSARIFMAVGVNDILFNDTAANAYNNTATLWRHAREQGFKLTAFTIPQSLGYEAADLIHWTNYNALIVSNAWAYDALVRRDLLYPKTNTVDFLADGLHFNGTGYRKVAEAVSASLSTAAPRVWYDNVIIGGDGRAPANVFGSIWGDYDAISPTRGVIKFHDGTTTNSFVAVDTTDAPATGQIPKVQSDGRVTWEDDAGGAGATPGGADMAIQFNQGATTFAGTNRLYYDRTNESIIVAGLIGKPAFVATNPASTLGLNITANSIRGTGGDLNIGADGREWKIESTDGSLQPDVAGVDIGDTTRRVGELWAQNLDVQTNVFVGRSVYITNTLVVTGNITNAGRINGQTNVADYRTFTKAGGSTTYAAAGGTIYSFGVKTANAGFTETNLINATIGGHILTNNNSYLIIEGSGSMAKSVTGTNQIRLLFGSSVLADTGLQTASNGWYRIRASISAQPTSTSQYITADVMWWGTGVTGMAFRETNFNAYISETNGIDTALKLATTSYRNGGLTNEMFRVRWYPNGSSP